MGFFAPSLLTSKRVTGGVVGGWDAAHETDMFAAAPAGHTPDGAKENHNLSIAEGWYLPNANPYHLEFCWMD